MPAYIFIAKFKDEEGDSIKTTIMPREIWTLHRRLDVTDPIQAIHFEQFFRLPPWGTDYMRAHKLMSSINYYGKAMITDKDGVKVQVLITTEIVNEALHFHSETYDLIPKTKSIDNEKAFLKVKGNKFKYSDMIYTELELPLRLISQHLRVHKPQRYTKPLLHMVVVMALCVAEKRQARCNYEKFILENLIEANLKNSSKNKLYMSARPMLTRIAYQALGMIKDLPAAGSQASLIQQARYVPKAVKTTTSTASSRTTRSTKKSFSDDERIEIDKDQDSDEFDKEYIRKGAEAPGPSEHEPSDQEDTSTPLDKKSKKPRMDGNKEEGSSSEDRQPIPTAHEIGESSGQAEKALQSKKVALASSLLKDTAFLWWNRRVADGKRTPSWQKFRSAIHKAFEPANADFHARSSLRRLSQTGSLAAYITEFQRLTLEIETLSPLDKLHSFIDCLEPNLKDDVHKFNPATLDAAIAYVERLGDNRRQGRNFFSDERSFNNNRSFQRDNRGRYSQNQQRSSQNYQPARQFSSGQFFGNQSSEQQSFRPRFFGQVAPSQTGFSSNGFRN
ncbi:hypothetical protein L7F22_037351 [Adiantum nelumboides]|nr:hypothetical protein [Adiantum nelumboides]